MAEVELRRVDETEIAAVRAFAWPDRGDVDDLPEPAFAPENLLDDEGHRLPPSEGARDLVEIVIRSHPGNLADHSRHAYRRNLHWFLAFCEIYGREVTSLLALRDFCFGLAWPRIRYLEKLRRSRRSRPLPRGSQPGIAWSTATQLVAAVSVLWQHLGWAPPGAYHAWKRWFQGLHVALAQARDQKDALTVEHLEKALSELDDTLEDLPRLRDRAIILLGFHAALRVSEIAGLAVGDIRPGPSGWELWLPSSKTDQVGAGITKPLYEVPGKVHLDPIRAYEAWLDASGLGDGPLFRGFTRTGTLRQRGLSADTVRQIITRWCDLPNAGGHSLRIGYVTQGAREGRSLEQIMQVTAHRDYRTALRYYNEANLHQRGPGPLGT